MDATIEQLILDELQELRSDLRGFRAEVAAWKQEAGERVTALEVTSKDISGNGKQGRMKDAEDRITVLERIWWKLLGGSAAVSAIVAAIWHVLPLVKH